MDSGRVGLGCSSCRNNGPVLWLSLQEGGLP